MADYILWRRLTETDFNAMNGTASPNGRGGGAMHISLGVRRDAFPIDDFIESAERTTVRIETAPQVGVHNSGRLTFATNPGRRRGEWVVRDQFNHRHPAWTVGAGFPTAYKEANPPYIVVLRVENVFHVRFASAKKFGSLATELPKGAVGASKGIATATSSLLRAFAIDIKSLLETFEQQTDLEEPFDPTDVADGRRRVLAAVLRRQGQPFFRRALLKAYDSRCVMTRCRTTWVLEAAHITPYRGTKTNTLSNGLLLRADVHTLFDLGLISIEPEERKITISKKLFGSTYGELHGKKVLEPKSAIARPSPIALKAHFDQFLR